MWMSESEWTVNSSNMLILKPGAVHRVGIPRDWVDASGAVRSGHVKRVDLYTVISDNDSDAVVVSV